MIIRRQWSTPCWSALRRTFSKGGKKVPRGPALCPRKSVPTSGRLTGSEWGEGQGDRQGTRFYVLLRRGHYVSCSPARLCLPVPLLLPRVELGPSRRLLRIQTVPGIGRAHAGFHGAGLLGLGTCTLSLAGLFRLAQCSPGPRCLILWDKISPLKSHSSRRPA